MLNLWDHIKVGSIVVAAILFGAGFAESVLSIAGASSVSGWTVAQTVEVPQSIAVVVDNVEAEAKGSDDSTRAFPVSQYNVKSPVPKLNADSYLVADLETGEVIVSKFPGTIYPIASVSKLVTALVAQSSIPSKQEVVVTKSALATYGPSGGLLSGENVRAGDLIYPLLLESSNDVALLISEQFGQGEFVKMMNAKAEEIGMKSTSFEEASGLSENNVSNTEDLFVLAQYIYREFPSIYDITRIREFALRKHTWTNHNYMLQFETFVGGKNGYTDEALRTTVSVFELPIKHGKTTETRPIAVILLHTDTREQDVVKLLDFVKKSVEL